MGKALNIFWYIPSRGNGRLLYHVTIWMNTESIMWTEETTARRHYNMKTLFIKLKKAKLQDILLFYI